MELGPGLQQELAVARTVELDITIPIVSVLQVQLALPVQLDIIPQLGQVAVQVVDLERGLM